MPDDHTGLLTGSHWGGIEVYDRPVFVTFSFPTVANAYVAAIDDPNLTPAALASWQAVSAAEADLARAALQEWGDACGITFIEVAPGQGDINFQKLDFSGTGYDGAGGIGYFPFGEWSGFSYPYFTGDLDVSGDVFLNSDTVATYALILHEIGHALGLKHPAEAWTNFAADPDVVHAVWAADDPDATIMAEQSNLAHLSAIDIAAIQAIYGTGAEDGTQVASWSWNAAAQRLTQTGFAGDDAMRGVSVRDTMNGAGGNDRLYGLAGNDVLNGGQGNDTLDGGQGIDRMTGGDGDDVYFVGVFGDKAIEAAGGGFDTAYATVTWVMGAEIEVLAMLGDARVTGTGNALGNEMYAGGGAVRFNGLDGADYMVGGAGKDTLAGGAQGDVMWGGAEADRFLFETAADFGASGAPDTIGDFSRAQKDKIDLRLIDPDSATPGDQAFSFVGTAALTADARFQLRYAYDGFGNTVVEIDINRDAVADHTILLYGEIALRAADFLL
jgi:YD repeat-containing protein